MKKSKTTTTTAVPPTAPTRADLEAAKAEALRILAEAIEWALDVLTTPAGVDTSSGQWQITSLRGRDSLDANQLAAALGLPGRAAIYELVYKKKIPVIRLGPRTLRFSLPAVQRALKKLTVSEASPLR